MAGAGLKGGRVLGSTDDFVVQEVDMRIDAHAVQRDHFSPLGLDHKRVTYLYQGRDMRLNPRTG